MRRAAVAIAALWVPLSGVSGSLAQSVPDLDAVIAAFRDTFGSDCDSGGMDSDLFERFPPEVYSVGSPDRGERLYVLICNLAAYNATYALYLSRPDGQIEQLEFATPVVNFGASPDDAGESAAFVRFDTDALLFNVVVDPAQMSITARVNWRGLGDAFSEGRWVLRDGEVVLTDYVIDPTLDLEENPIQIVQDEIVVLP
ncbi:MAG: hypothetical protein KIS96_03905 [Bauldia sp.]|nr:hypothetical protein [Bauldia sp.]